MKPYPTAIAVLTIVLAACSSAPRRSADQPPITSTYKGWTITVTPSQIDDFWRARIRVWPPEVQPEAHPGINVRFSGTSTNRQAVEQAATAVARQYVDAMVSTH